MAGKSGLNDVQRKTLQELLEYAESLGIVETLPLDGTETDDSPTAESTAEQKYYKYLIVIDFESTCWDDKADGARKPEIIGKHDLPSILMSCLGSDTFEMG